MIIPLKVFKLTLYSKVMVTKKILLPLILTSFCFMLMGCPENLRSDECRDQWKTVQNVPDLVRITPLNETYHIGDTMTVEISIDSQSDFFDEPVDMYQYTLAEEIMGGGLALQGDQSLFDNNNTVLKGDLRIVDISKIMFLIYYPEDHAYRFKCVFEFSEVGEYQIPNFFRIVFHGEDLCRVVNIDRTNILGISQNESFYSFTVVP